MREISDLQRLVRLPQCVTYNRSFRLRALIIRFWLPTLESTFGAYVCAVLWAHGIFQFPRSNYAFRIHRMPFLVHGDIVSVYYKIHDFSLFMFLHNVYEHGLLPYFFTFFKRDASVTGKPHFRIRTGYTLFRHLYISDICMYDDTTSVAALILYLRFFSVFDAPSVFLDYPIKKGFACEYQNTYILSYKTLLSQHFDLIYSSFKWECFCCVEHIMCDDFFFVHNLYMCVMHCNVYLFSIDDDDDFRLYNRLFEGLSYALAFGVDVGYVHYHYARCLGSFYGVSQI